MRRLIPLLLLVAATAAPSHAAPGVLCSWYTKTDPDTFNVAFPDASAVYWNTELNAVPGTRVVITGSFPDARYMSFHVYDAVTNTVAAIPDHRIEPDAGSVNPFRSVAEGPRRYTVNVVFTAAPADPEPNTIYAGATRDGLPNLTGALIYRVYLADDPSDQQGGVPLPDVTIVNESGSVTLPQCDPLPPSTGGALNGLERSSSFPDEFPRVVPLGGNYTDPPTTTPAGGGLENAVWGRIPPAVPTEGLPHVLGTLYTNEDAAYLTTRISRTFGDVVVYRFKAPSFPNTRAGDPPLSGPDLRYWSMCEYEFASQRVIACTRDDQANVGADGIARFVISDVADRPDGDDFDWLPWGGLYYEGFVAYRQLVADPGFEGAIAAIGPDEDPAASMGSWWPEVRYCSRATIESTGFDSCFTPSS